MSVKLIEIWNLSFLESSRSILLEGSVLQFFFSDFCFCLMVQQIYNLNCRNREIDNDWDIIIIREAIKTPKTCC